MTGHNAASVAGHGENRAAEIFAHFTDDHADDMDDHQIGPVDLRRGEEMKRMRINHFSLRLPMRIRLLMPVLILAGCAAGAPNIKMPAQPPDIVAQYRHVTLYAGTVGMMGTGVQLKTGDAFTIIASGEMDFCPNGRCQSRRVRPDMAWPLLSRIGDGSGGYLSALPAHRNFYMHQAHSDGELFIGYRQGTMDARGYPDNPEWYRNDTGFFGVDIIVWRALDYGRIGDFLETLLPADPENRALAMIVNQARHIQKVELAKNEAVKAIAETQKALDSLRGETAAGEAVPPPPPSETAPLVADKAAATDPDAKLAELEALMARLESLKQELAAEKQRARQMAVQLDASAEREKALQAKLASSVEAPPVVVIANPSDGAETVAARINLIGVVEDQNPIARIEILVNGKPLALKSGRGIVVAASSEPARRLDFNHEVPLELGANQIRVRAVDSSGLVAERTMTVTRRTIRNNLWAVVIGVNAYLKANPLKFAVADAQAFYRYLVEQSGVPRENVVLLIDAQASLNQLRSALGTGLKRKAGPEDTVLIYFAGHGATESETMSPDGDGLEKYLLPVDADPADLYATAMPMREIAHIFARIRSERLVFIADACYSGASGGRTLHRPGIRAGISDKFLDRISSGKGRVIITASNASEISAESDQFGHGVFTYYLLDGLKGRADVNRDGLISVDEVYAYVSAKVPAATGQDQHPMKKGDVEGQMFLGIVPAN